MYLKYPSDVTWEVDREFTNESWAYHELQDRGLNGKYTPKYHGSFGFSLPLLSPPGVPRKSYNSRLILLEDIPRVLMQDLIDDGTVWDIHPQTRLDILAHVLEIDFQLRFIGIGLPDIAPRNAINVGWKADQTTSRVLLLDLANADLINWDTSTKKDERQVESHLPYSPLCTYWYENSEFGMWTPMPHRSGDLKAWRGWLLRRWLNAEGWMPCHHKHHLEENREAEYCDPEPDVIPPNWLR